MIENKPLIYHTFVTGTHEVFGQALKNVLANYDRLADSWRVLDNTLPGQEEYLRVRLELRRLDIEYLEEDPLRFPWFWRQVNELEIRSGEIEEWAKNVLVITLPTKADFERFYVGDLDEIPTQVEWDIVKALLTYRYAHLSPDELQGILESYRKLDEVRELPSNKIEIDELLQGIEIFLGEQNGTETP